MHPEVILRRCNSSISQVSDALLPKDIAEWDLLCLSIMLEITNPDTLWRPYLDVLPYELNSYLFWSEDHKKMVAGSSLQHLDFDQAKKNFEDTVLPFIKQCDLFDVNVHDFSMFRRVISLIMAYSFTYVNDETVMLPFADMLNAKTGYNNARVYFEENESSSPILTMKATKDILKGSEIFNTYGDLSNADLLRKYGYVDNINPNNCVEISFDTVANTAKVNTMYFEARLPILLELGLIDQYDSFIIGSDTNIPEDLDFIIKAFISDKEEWESIFDGEQSGNELRDPEDGNMYELSEDEEISDIDGMSGISDIDGMSGISDIDGMSGISDIDGMSGIEFDIELEYPKFGNIDMGKYNNFVEKLILNKINRYNTSLEQDKENLDKLIVSNRRIDELITKVLISEKEILQQLLETVKK
eukprot:TRINITY_DN869_c0_g1_i4.p1 TRINITY_DN869_c0_g1~~TRINITY_DN869_c0_g1_i4.p1  ORF type:complete len:415 (-),score=108.49 TRINITY_DN869_c0_g1_i4:13-1257(-)